MIAQANEILIGDTVVSHMTDRLFDVDNWERDGAYRRKITDSLTLLCVNDWLGLYEKVYKLTVDRYTVIMLEDILERCIIDSPGWRRRMRGILAQEVAYTFNDVVPLISHLRDETIRLPDLMDLGFLFRAFDFRRPCLMEPDRVRIVRWILGIHHKSFIISNTHVDNGRIDNDPLKAIPNVHRILEYLDGCIKCMPDGHWLPYAIEVVNATTMSVCLAYARRWSAFGGMSEALRTVQLKQVMDIPKEGLI